jgi:hypothetical protein
MIFTTEHPKHHRPACDFPILISVTWAKGMIIGFLVRVRITHQQEHWTHEQNRYYSLHVIAPPSVGIGHLRIRFSLPNLWRTFILKPLLTAIEDWLDKDQQDTGYNLLSSGGKMTETGYKKKPRQQGDEAYGACPQGISGVGAPSIFLTSTKALSVSPQRTLSQGF